MNNEIKEILDELINDKRTDRFGRIMFEISKGKQLLNYITNLQEENEDLKADYGSKAQVERDILQNRIDKTIEYIENHFLYHYGSEKRPIVFEDNYIQETIDILRGEVEIIEDTPKEDKKIEKLKLYVPYLAYTDERFEDIEDKINEIIDRLNGDTDE